MNVSIELYLIAIIVVQAITIIELRNTQMELKDLIRGENNEES